MTSRKHSKNGGDSGTGVYMQEGTTLRVMVADKPYGKFHDFYNISLEYFGYHHIKSILAYVAGSSVNIQNSMNCQDALQQKHTNLSTETT
jgi:hypothetical protein